jgi:hypothetical protein
MTGIEPAYSAWEFSGFQRGTGNRLFRSLPANAEGQKCPEIEYIRAVPGITRFDRLSHHCAQRPMTPRLAPNCACTESDRGRLPDNGLAKEYLVVLQYF